MERRMKEPYRDKHFGNRFVFDRKGKMKRGTHLFNRCAGSYRERICNFISLTGENVGQLIGQKTGQLV